VGVGVSTSATASYREGVKRRGVLTGVEQGHTYTAVWTALVYTAHLLCFRYSTLQCTVPALQRHKVPSEWLLQLQAERCRRWREHKRQKVVLQTGECWVRKSDLKRARTEGLSDRVE
jgi:hypothetical protein